MRLGLPIRPRLSFLRASSLFPVLRSKLLRLLPWLLPWLKRIFQRSLLLRLSLIRLRLLLPRCLLSRWLCLWSGLRCLLPGLHRRGLFRSLMRLPRLLRSV